MRVLRTMLAGTAAVALAAFGAVTVLTSPAAAAPVGAQGTYVPLTPARLLDTRTGNGAPAQIVGHGATVHLQVAGRGGVPASGVSAVVLNLTITGALGNGYLTAYPDGAARPNASSINFATGWTRSNQITVAIGANGYLNIYQQSLGTHIVADVAGYYNANAAAPMGSTYLPDVEQWRLDDTRLDGAPPKEAGETNWYSIYFEGDPEASAAITAFVLNITAVGATANGYLATWNGVGPRPANVSSVNYRVGGVWPNGVVVPTGPCDFCGDPSQRMFAIYNHTSTHYVIDVVGYYFNDTIDGFKFTPMTPKRILDTRSTSAIGPGGVRTANGASAATPETYALSINVAATKPTENTFLTVWPGGPRPSVSLVNPSAGQTVANGTTVEVDVDNQFQIWNYKGSTHVVVDVGGRFEYFPPAEARVAQTAPQLKLNGQRGAVRHG